MGIELPKARFSAPPQLRKRQVPIDQIIKVMGNNPIAGAIDDIVPAISKALNDRAERRRQQQVIKAIAEAAGETPPTDSEGMTPGNYEGLLRLKGDRAAKRSAAADQRVGRELQLEGLRTGTTERDPLTGIERQRAGVRGLNLTEDEFGDTQVSRGEDYAPRSLLKLPGGGMGGGKAGRSQQVGATAEGFTVSFNPNTKMNEVARPDGRGGMKIEPYYGLALPKTAGSEEQRRMGLASMGRDSLEAVKATLQANPGALQEVKGIKYSPGNVYGQFASPEAKELFTNIQNILQAETYATTGAAMSIPELEQKSLMFMVKLNDSPQDAIGRLEIANRNLGSLTQRQLPKLPVGQNGAAPGGMSVGRFQVEVEQ